jgi:CheY-like chemotaxis protein
MTTITSQRERILVVDDLPAHRRVVAFNLEKAGFRVETAESAAEALKLAEQKRFDLVITDYFMPESTGADLVRSLRETDGYADTPVILLTARAPELNLAHLANSLSARVVSKSCSVARLIAMVAGSLSARRNES